MTHRIKLDPVPEVHLLPGRSYLATLCMLHELKTAEYVRYSCWVSGLKIKLACSSQETMSIINF